MKKIIRLICLIQLLWGMPSLAQERAGGLLFDDEVYDTISRLPAYDGSKDLQLPKQVDLSPYCPEVRNQGEIFSCVGWAVGYGAMTIRRAIREGWTDKATITANAYSALFIYNQIREGNCRQGSRLSSAMELLRRKGDCSASAFDFNVEDCEKQPAPSLLRLAQKDTISDYLALFDRNDHPKKKIWKVKRALAQREPVIIGMSIRQNFYQLRQARYWWPEIGNTLPAGGHAMTVVGYDDQAQAFLIFNSWGTTWGDRGYIRVKYEHFAEYCKYAYLLVGELATKKVSPKKDHPAVSVKSLTKFSASAQLKHLEDFYGSEPIFKNTSVVGQHGLYSTQQKWTTGQLFQLAAVTRQENMYLYVFSIDPSGTPHVHWPRKGQWNRKFAGKNESALVVEAESRITVPGVDKALRTQLEGRDVLYMLFAKRKLKGLKFICKKMSGQNQSPMQSLRNLMGNHLIPLADIQYEQNQAGFNTETRSEGYIVPIVLVVESSRDGQ